MLQIKKLNSKGTLAWSSQTSIQIKRAKPTKHSHSWRQIRIQTNNLQIGMFCNKSINKWQTTEYNTKGSEKVHEYWKTQIPLKKWTANKFSQKNKENNINKQINGKTFSFFSKNAASQGSKKRMALSLYRLCQVLINIMNWKYIFKDNIRNGCCLGSTTGNVETEFLISQ